MLDDAKEFLYNWRKGQYQHTKLANALFSSELNRRLLPLGVQSCAVDPGGVNSSIWDRGGFLSRPPFRTIIGALYAPPSDGATAVVHAATSPWKPRSPVRSYIPSGCCPRHCPPAPSPPLPPAHDMLTC